MAHIFNEANFSQDVLQSPVPVLVDFWAEWCGPCQSMGPIIEELAQEIPETKLKIGKMNVDQNQETPMRHNIMSIPTFLVFKDGQVVDQFVGGMSKEMYKEKLAKYAG